MPDFPSFWKWLVRPDRDGDRGIFNIANRWVAFHALVALALSSILKIDVADLATKVAIPGASILVGLSFAWAGRSASLFQDKGFSEFIIRDGAPVEGYLYSFQLAILTVLAFLLITFFVFSGGFGTTTGNSDFDETINKASIIFFGSLALRECWGAIGFVNKLTIQYYVIREVELKNAD